MRNIADVIENFIIRKVLADEAEQTFVQRNELADKLSCAPSQISYVLSTRFTPERGYTVESRRGSGGFVRIVRLVSEEQEHNNQTVPSNAELVRQLLKTCEITAREGILLAYMLEISEGQFDIGQKRTLLKEAVFRLTGTESDD